MPCSAAKFFSASNAIPAAAVIACNCEDPNKTKSNLRRFRKFDGICEIPVGEHRNTNIIKDRVYCPSATFDPPGLHKA
jgi:hypothetical protein